MPKRGKISYKDCLNRLNNRRDISLKEEDYYGWGLKAKFYDHIVQEFFWATPSNVYKQNSGHPKRTAHKRKQTFLRKYGVENASQLDEIKHKKQQKSFEKYGTSCTLHAPEIRKEVKKKWLRKYGTEWPAQSPKVKQKQQQTLLNKYGVDNFSKSILFRKQISNRFIKETGEHLKLWLERQVEPKPAYITLTQHFDNYEYIQRAIISSSA